LARRFVGREKELLRLQMAWQKVARTDGLPPEPQMIVLLAESGLGKTRLVQEFYRWLSTAQDPVSEAAIAGYWPDAFDTDSESLDVNPRFPEDAAGRGPIPWLWWGLRFERPFGRNQIGNRCGLIDYRSALMPHVGPIAVARKLKDVKTGRLWKWTGIAFTLAGAFAGPVGLAAGAIIGTIAALGFAAKDAFSDRQDRKQVNALREQAGRSAGAAQAAERTELEELALNYFRTVLDDGNKDAATVPVVIFLDDAQWADPVTLRFLARLMAEAREKHWPLMVISTHWEVEWKQALSDPVVEGTRPERLSAVSALLQTPDEDPSSWLDLHILPPISDLSGIVREALPGLTDDQRRAVLDKAGGNPLLLEEILLFLFRRPEFFEGRKFDRPLTDRGLERLHSEKMELEKLFDDRFHSLEDGVQRSLGWSSEQGFSFLTEITLASAKCVDATMTEERLREALRQADSPHSLIQTFGDPGTFNRSEFRQAAFHKVAHEFLKFHPDELDCVQQAIRDSLSAWLLTGRVDQLPQEERLDALLMARRSLSPADDEPENIRQAWCQGMVRLAQLYQTQYLWDQAWGVAEAWAQAAPNGWPIEWLAFWPQVELCRILRSGREYRLAGQIMRPLVQSLTRFADTAPDQPTLQDLSVSLNESAMWNSRKGVVRRRCPLTAAVWKSASGSSTTSAKRPRASAT